MRAFLVTVKRLRGGLEIWKVRAVNASLAAREARMRAQREGKIISVTGVRESIQ